MLRVPSLVYLTNTNSKPSILSNALVATDSTNISDNLQTLGSVAVLLKKSWLSFSQMLILQHF